MSFALFFWAVGLTGSDAGDVNARTPGFTAISAQGFRRAASAFLASGWTIPTS